MMLNVVVFFCITRDGATYNKCSTLYSFCFCLLFIYYIVLSSPFLPNYIHQGETQHSTIHFTHFFTAFHWTRKVLRAFCWTALPSINLAKVHSLAKKMDELLLFNSANTDFLRCAILCFTETWLGEHIPDSTLYPLGFQLLRAERLVCRCHNVKENMHIFTDCNPFSPLFWLVFTT